MCMVDSAEVIHGPPRTISDILQTKPLELLWVWSSTLLLVRSQWICPLP